MKNAPAKTNNEIIELGTDQAFALKDQNGEIKAFKTNLDLSVKEGTLVSIGYGNNKTTIISAQGYEKWAEKTGASVIFPKDVLVGDQLKPNPCAERDPKNNRILAVHARAVAFKYSSMGLPQVCDWTTIFDVPSYRMIDLLAKAKKTPQAFKLLPEGMEPKTTKSGNETWAKYRFDEATNLWLNTGHNEVLDWFSSIINREKKAMDFAQTFARRNATKHLSGIQKAPGEQWTLPVLAWRPTGDNIVKWDASQYSQLQDRVSGMIDGDHDQFQGETKQLTVQKGVETISQELDEAEIQDDVNPGDFQDVEEAEKEQPSNDVKKQEIPKDLPKELHQLAAIRIDFPKEYDQAATELRVKSKKLEDLNTQQAVAIYQKINTIIDENNE